MDADGGNQRNLTIIPVMTTTPHGPLTVSALPLLGLGGTGKSM